MVRWLSFIHYARSGKLRAISRKPFDPPFPLRASANFCGLLRKSLSPMWLTRLAAVPLKRKTPATDTALFFKCS